MRWTACLVVTFLVPALGVNWQVAEAARTLPIDHVDSQAGSRHSGEIELGNMNVKRGQQKPAKSARCGELGHQGPAATHATGVRVAGAKRVIHDIALSAAATARDPQSSPSHGRRLAPSENWHAWQSLLRGLHTGAKALLNHPFQAAAECLRSVFHWAPPSPCPLPGAMMSSLRFQGPFARAFPECTWSIFKVIVCDVDVGWGSAC